VFHIQRITAGTSVPPSRDPNAFRRARTWAIGLALGLAGTLPAADAVKTGEANPPAASVAWNITVERPILQAAPGSPVQTTIRIQPNGPGKIAQVRWEQQPDRINPFAASRSAVVVPVRTNPLEFLASFPGPGIYQLVATVGVGAQITQRTTWIHVWDPTPATWKEPNGQRPEMAPPPSVRNLSRDPGPFAHPRLLVTAQDWPEIAQRNQRGKVASGALAALRQTVAEKLDNPIAEAGRLAIALGKAAAGQGPVPDLGGKTTSDPRATYGILWNAAYLNWLEGDPRLPVAQAPTAQRTRGLILARLISTLAKTHFAHIWDRKGQQPLNRESPWFVELTNTGSGLGNDLATDLAFAYDFAYRWMNEEQRRDTRDFLYALGFGRRTSGAFTGDTPNRGNEQNGDFGNGGDYQMLTGLAVEGEESAVSPDVQAYFGKPTQPWMAAADPTDPCAWPGAWKSSVDNLWRQIRWMSSENLSPQGYVATGPSYYGWTMRRILWPMLALARRGENQFITTNFYQAVMSEFHITHPGCDGNLHVYAHQDGEHGTDWRVHFLWKYLYPDDPLVDYVYQYQTGLDLRWMDPAIVSLFGLDPGINGKPTTLEEVAKAKALPLITFDPFQMAPVVRNSWRPDDLTVRWTCGAPFGGHNQHAETNSFSLYALGRAWSSPPGYHIVPADLQTGILVQDPRFLYDQATEGYLGMAQSAATLASSTDYGRPPAGTFIGLAEDPKSSSVIMAGNAAPAYDTAGDQPYNPVLLATRTLLVMRGRNPYLLVIDDFQKDEHPRNYRWIMSNSLGFGVPDGRFVNGSGQAVTGSMVLEAGATADRGVLFHECDKSLSRRPSLLVAEIGLQQQSKPGPQPPMVIDRTPQCYGREINRPGKPISTAPADRLIIERDHLVRPGFTVLLYPFLAGEPLPTLAWSKDQQVLTIKHGSGTTDMITFDRTQPDHRTRLAVSRK
jgi:hypothetical protein